MNIFLIVLISLFMTSYYMLFSPNTRIYEHETEQAINKSDLRSIAECALAVHNATLKGKEFDDPCIKQNEIVSQSICLDSKQQIISCEVTSRRKPDSYIVTATATLDDSNYNNIMEILEQDYTDVGTFGIYEEGFILSGGTTTKRAVPVGIQKHFDLKDGCLVYLTKYSLPDIFTEYQTPEENTLECPDGTSKFFRFGRWQCIGYNTKTNCAGDTVWDSGLMECVANNSRKPLCASKQTAVLVDSVWECVDPFSDRVCPENMIARLNYDLLEWECVEDPSKIEKQKKCAHKQGYAISSKFGSTLRIPINTSCTDCERLIIDEETCISKCVPDITKLNNRSCYPGNVNECKGKSRGIYFGFPDGEYTENIDEINPKDIPFDKQHAQNRKFNCLDCGDGQIDDANTNFPYTATCK